MGVTFSYPFAKCSDVENGLESVIVKSISFGDDEVKTPVRSISFKSIDSEPTILKSVGSGKMILEGSVSFKGIELERMLSGKTQLGRAENLSIKAIGLKSKAIDIQTPKPDTSIETPKQLPVLDPSNPQHEAAIRLQKVYKSFRTRRKLADCAVLVAQSWWELLDFAELKRSSISFFDIDKHETAISRWSRARTKAAKVGKGLSKNDKAQKLALQHWLEAIDPRHRYGHNLHLYYNQWLQSQSQEPFFYWLDIGEGKEVNLEKCPRLKLQQQCIKYLGPMERKPYEVIVVDGKFIYKQTRKLLHTTGEDRDAKSIFVLSTSKILYVGMKKKGKFQHSSFLAGGATIAAGRLVVDSGVLKAVWPHSGHYRPTEENFNDFISYLRENNVDLTDVKMTPLDEDESLANKQRSSNHLRCNSSEEDFILETEEVRVKDSIKVVVDSRVQETRAALERPRSSRLLNLSRKLTNLEIPRRSELFEMSDVDHRAVVSCNNDNSVDSPLEDGYETEEETIASEQDSMVPKQKIDKEVEDIPEESILQRINSKKGLKSYQLGKQLSCKWTTGAGPRIGCVRDYPSELQFRALEQVNLSPRSASDTKSYFSPRSASSPSPKVSTPAGATEEMRTLSLPVLKKENLLQRSIHSRMQSSALLRGALVCNIP
ncbi:PREDICTED: IQ domain-containing protein IQM2 [Theobroma cacao]|uniref:IQ domain-containing protein IQM2 n=1 Tax=Theobroma cacao TaxID=3641 RepID=A0AB32URD1_THECC|nr:PREDICTED: IQ domain-containing protein IQM2 [Theobroma cacao]